MFEFGEITDIDAATGFVKVFIPETGNVTEWIPFARPYYGESILIEPNMQVLVGQTGSGRWFVMGCTPNKTDKPYTGSAAKKRGIKFSDGTLIEYDLTTHKYTINCVGEVDIIAATKITAVATLEADITAPIIKLTGAVTVVGVLTASGGLAISGGGLALTGGHDITSDGDVKAGAISLAGHKHGGVQIGGGVSGIAF